MNNALIVKILSGVVSQAPKVNQETVDNVKAVIAYMEEKTVEAPKPSLLPPEEKGSDPLELNQIPPLVSEPKLIKRRKRGKNKKK